MGEQTRSVFALGLGVLLSASSACAGKAGETARSDAGSQTGVTSPATLDASDSTLVGAPSSGPIGAGLLVNTAYPEGGCVSGSGIDPAPDAGPSCDATCQGTCVGGRCLITLASVQNSNMNAMTIDSTSVYWTEFPAGTVKKVPLGGGSVTTLASGQAGPLGIAVDSTSVYWTSESQTGTFPNITQTGTVIKATMGGGSRATLATLQSNPDSIAVDSTSLYWANGGTVMCQCGSIVRAALDGSSATTLVSGRNLPSTVVVDSESAYWLENGGGTVLKVPLGGGSPLTLAIVSQRGPSPGIGATLAIDGTAAYWTNSGGPSEGGTVLKVPLAGGAVTTIASGQCAPAGIAVDGTSVYWANSSGNNGTIVKAALDGSNVTTLASGQSYPGSVAVDSASVYWANMVGDTVMKLTPK